MAKIFLRKKITNRIANGHNWVFNNEIGDIIGEVPIGAEVAVFSYTGSFVGKGWYAGENSIAVRMLSRDVNEKIDEGFVLEKIKKAIQSRVGLPIDPACHRVFNAESDGISGLNIDKWQDYYVVQCLTKALDMRYEWIEKVLIQIGIPTNNILKDDSSKLRKFEQLPISSPLTFPSIITIIDNAATFELADVTAYSLDRILLRTWIATVSKDKKVWDLCCGNGNLGNNALHNDAQSVLFLDNESNWKNYFDEKSTLPNASFILENVFDFLKKKQAAKADLIILDPPIFTENVAKPLVAYRELIIGALKQLHPHGLLLVGNSSSKITDHHFLQMLETILTENKISFRIIHTIGQSPDFGTISIYPHLDYLSFWVLQRCDE